MSEPRPFSDWRDHVLYLPPALKLADCERIRWREIAFPSTAVVIDASALCAIDSIGVAALLRLQALARAVQVDCVWRGIGAQLRTLIQVYELDDTELFTCKNN